MLLVTVLLVVGKNEYKNPVSDSWNNKVLYDMIGYKTVINHALGWVRWMAHWIKALAAKPGDLSSIPRTYMVRRKVVPLTTP